MYIYYLYVYLMEIPVLTADLTLPDRNELPAISLNDLHNKKWVILHILINEINNYNNILIVHSDQIMFSSENRRARLSSRIS